MSGPRTTRPDDAKLYRALRKAWKDGENPTKLVVDGKEHELHMRSYTRKASYVTEQGTKQKPGEMNVHHREEEWVVARPKGPGPVFNFEPRQGCNSRVTALL